MEWMLMPLQRYADFSGRSRRKEYWMFFLFCFIVSFVLGIVDGAAGLNGILGLIFQLAVLVPSIAVAVRRAHDQDKSGWFILIPIYGFILMFLEGTNGPNRFGPDPKGGADPATFE